MLEYMDIQMDSQESSKQHKMSCRLALDTISDLYCILETLCMSTHQSYERKIEGYSYLLKL